MRATRLKTARRHDPRRRSILLAGLRLTLSRFPAILWTYALNLGLALLFSLRLHAQLSSILSHSLAAQRLTSAFDLGTLLEALARLSHNAPSSGSANFLGLPLYLLGYFILVPGTLAAYQAPAAPATLAALLADGLAFFWRFIRITLLTALVSAAVLVPLSRFYGGWATHISNHHVGLPAFLARLPVAILIVLAAALLRLFFDLVEVYTVQLGSHLRPNGKPDRRVRRTLLPAFRTLRRHFVHACGTFLALAALGLLAVLFTGRIALHMLAQPRVWPVFLLSQAGLLFMLFTRFWQRGAETILCLDFPLSYASYNPQGYLRDNPQPDPALSPTMPAPPPDPPTYRHPDAQPNPEPIAPSLPTPDPGIFHHDPAPLPPQEPKIE